MSMAIKIPSPIGATAGAVDETTARSGYCQPALGINGGRDPGQPTANITTSRQVAACVCRRFPRDILGHVCPKKLPRCSWNRGRRAAGDVRRIRHWRIRSIYPSILALEIRISSKNSSLVRELEAPPNSVIVRQFDQERVLYIINEESVERAFELVSAIEDLWRILSEI